MLETLDHMKARLKSDFVGPYLIFEIGINFVSTDESGDHLRTKQGMFVIMANVDEGYRHRAVVVPGMDENDWEWLMKEGLRKLTLEAQSSLQIKWGIPSTGMENWQDQPFSKSIYIYTDELQLDKSRIYSSARVRSLSPKIVDNIAWQERFDKKVPDLFISYDARDTKDIAEPLYHDLCRRSLKVWFAEYSLMPGDVLAHKIDAGLAECRHAVLIVTPHLLENSGWASREMSSLLNRSMDKPNMIIPVWWGVEKEDVLKRSALLADIFALQGTIGNEAIADRIFSVVGGC